MSEVHSLIDLNDADILVLEGVLKHLNKKQGTRQSLEGFRKEAVERFGEAGFRVWVKPYEADTYGGEVIYAFDIEIRERLEGKFDPDQMVHETVSDILGLGTGGVIKTNGGLWTPPGTA
jgi:hypothetical protein